MAAVTKTAQLSVDAYTSVAEGKSNVAIRVYSNSSHARLYIGASLPAVGVADWFPAAPGSTIVLEKLGSADNVYMRAEDGTLCTANVIGWNDPALTGATFTGTAGEQGGDAVLTGGTSSTAANAGGAAKIVGGTPGATGAGGSAQVIGAAGGATSGAGGAGSVVGGAGTAGNSAGGVASVTGGAGQGSAAGGIGKTVGGAGGATGAGGAAQVTGGAGGATSGTGGAATIAAGAGTAGNSAGGVASVAGGAGQGTGAGGAASLTGGASGAGATGNGGAASASGGAASSSNGNGGDVVLTGGAKAGSGKVGAVYQRGTSIKAQAAPAAKTVTAAISAAELVAGLITTSGVTAPSIHQLPTGTLIDAELPGIATGDSFDFTIINTGTGASDDATITVNTDVTIVGSPTVGALTDATIISGSGRFRARRSGANTYVVYRLS